MKIKARKIRTSPKNSKRNPPVVQKQSSKTNDQLTSDPVQAKRNEMVKQSPQVAQLNSFQNLANNAIQKKSNNTNLPTQLKSGIENLSGISMDDVKVHYNSSKPAQLQAHAYAQGTNIHLGPGQEKHLPHEAWHVVQQKQGRVKPTMQLKSKVNVNDDVGLEREADVMGAKAIQRSSHSNLNTDVKKTNSITNTSIQRRIRVGEELYDKDIPPKTNFGFTGREISAYNIVNNCNSPIVQFGSIDEMKLFISQIAPLIGFFRTELHQLRSPIASGQVIEAIANQSEVNRGGHSLERHGPQMRLGHLRDRLTTGFIGGSFAPAGKQGFATSFQTHHSFLASKKAAIEHIQAAYNRTASALHPLVNGLKESMRGFDALSGASKGKQIVEINKNRKSIFAYIDNNHLSDPNRININMFPVKVNKRMQNIKPNEIHKVDQLLLFFDRYRIVLANNEQIGKGLKVNDAELGKPKAEVKNPLFPVSGTPEPVFHAHQLQSMGEIHNTATTVNPPNTQFTFNANIRNWAVPQHFPDNGAPGWRG